MYFVFCQISISFFFPTHCLKFLTVCITLPWRKKLGDWIRSIQLKDLPITKLESNIAEITEWPQQSKAATISIHEIQIAELCWKLLSLHFIALNDEMLNRQLRYNLDGLCLFKFLRAACTSLESFFPCFMINKMYIVKERK